MSSGSGKATLRAGMCAGATVGVLPALMQSAPADAARYRGCRGEVAAARPEGAVHAMVARPEGAVHAMVAESRTLGGM